jgi:hypothetical protein
MLFQIGSGAVSVLDLFGRICSVVRTFLPFYLLLARSPVIGGGSYFFSNGCVWMAQEE